MRWKADLILRIAFSSLLVFSFGPAGFAEISGRAIFEGKPDALDDPVSARRLERLPCHSCHGRDGNGGVQGLEGRAPPISAAALDRQTPERPAYTVEAFTAAVREGISPSGRALSKLMPRYQMSDDEADALFLYLDVLAEEQRSGVLPDRIIFGLDPWAEAAFGQAYRDAFLAEIAARIGGSVHGRSVDLVVLSEAISEDSNVIAALAAPVTNLAKWRDAGMPVLFPIGRLEGDEDPSMLRSFVPSERGLRRALAKKLASFGDVSVTSWPKDTAVETALRFGGVQLTNTVQLADEIIVLNGDIEGAARAAPDARLWVLASHMPRDLTSVETRQVMLIEDMPALMDITSTDPPHITHARISAGILAEVLKVAGRDLTRSALLRAFSEALLTHEGLDYAGMPLEGTDAVRFHDLDQ